MATGSLSVQNSSGSSLQYWVVSNGYTSSQIVSSGTLAQGVNSIPVVSGTNLRIYVSATDIFSSQNSAGGGEPSGLSIPDAFSFFEYTWDGTTSSTGFSADMSYINDWAYPIQSTVNGVAYGFTNATAIAQAMAALPPGNFLPTSAASGAAVGTVSDLFDSVNRRFVGPMSIWEWQASESVWTTKAATVGLPAGMAAGWASFGADVPWGPMPWGGIAPSAAAGLQPSANASRRAAGGTPPLPALGTGVPQPAGYPSPTFGFDFSSELDWSQMNNGAGSSVDPSGDSLYYASNYNVWNFGTAAATPNPPAGNIAPDDPSNLNAYTSILRTQASKDGGMNSYANGNPNFVGFYTFAKDDYNANYEGSLQQISLTIGALPSAATGTSADDVVVGTPADDVISGGYGADRLSGGPGAASSRLARTAGSGSDVFVYLRADNSGRGRGQRDVITDFDPSDRIDLSAVDANGLRSGTQPFRWIHQRTFTERAGQLRVDLTPRRYGLLQGDTDGDGKADFEVKMVGIDSLGRANLLL